jgi:hypothetical protein
VQRNIAKATVRQQSWDERACTRDEWANSTGKQRLLSRLEKFRALGDIPAAPAKLGIVVQDDFVFSVEPREQLADGFEANQAAAIDADEKPRIERVLERVERTPKSVFFLAAVEDDVVAIGFDPGNFADRNKEGTGIFVNEDTLGKAAFPLHLFEHVAETRQMRIARLRVLLADAAKRFAEADLAYGLEKVIESVNLKGMKSVLVVRRSEDDAGNRKFFCGKILDHTEAVHPGHLDIEKDEVRMELLDRSDGSFTTVGFRDNLDSCFLAEQAKDFSA